VAIGTVRSVTGADQLLQDDELTCKTLVLVHLVAKEPSQPVCGANQRRLLTQVLGERLAHAPVLGDELDELCLPRRNSA
jgi:hypothetical protein